MKQCKHILWFVLALALPANLAADENSGNTRKAPNIILIMADDLAWADVGYNGQRDLETCLLYTSDAADE